MSESIVDLFVGLTPQQVKTFRERIMPTLQSLRGEILKESGCVSQQARAPKQAEIEKRLEHGTMPIQNNYR